MALDAATWLKDALANARGRTAKSGRSMDIDLPFLLELWEAQGGRCAVSGIAFSDELHEKAFVKRPFAPSIDRIDCSGGYTRENVRLVSRVANFAMGEWGHTVLRRLAHGVVETERRDEKAWFRGQRAKLRRAEKAAEVMTGSALERQRRVIAGLKRSLTMGPARLGGAASAAGRSRASDD